MLIPQFTIRRLMVGVAACAIIALVIGQGVKGAAWAVAFSLALVVLALTMLVFGGVFVAVWLLSRAMSAGNPPQPLAATVIYTAVPPSVSPGIGPAPVDQA